MKILITTDLFATETNGVVTSVRNLWKVLMANGHEVRILTLSSNRHSYKDGKVSYVGSISLDRIYPNVRMPISYCNSLIRELIAWRPDVIHSQCEFFSYRFALRISELVDVPIVHTYHTLYEQYVGYVFPVRRLGTSIVRLWLRRRLLSASRIIVPTHKAEASLREWGVKTEICVIPSGICLEQHRRCISGEEREHMRKVLGIAEHQIVLLSLGRLGVEKNVEELVELFSRVSAECEEIVLLIVGDGPAKKALEESVAERELIHKVIFTGMVAPTVVQNYYQLGDIFVSASTSETQGLTYIEAAANRLPLLCRRDVCLQDVLREGENGYTYSDAEEFCGCLKKMLEDSDWRRRAGKQSEWIATRYDCNAFGNAVEAVYREIKK